jgi:hypothetical protein
MWCIIISLFPATVFLVIAYFVLYTSAKAEGFVGLFGAALGLWLFVVAAAFPTYSVYMSRADRCPIVSVPILMK